MTGSVYTLAAVLVLAMSMLFTGCSKEKEEAKNMEQIHKEEGVPVRTVRVMPKEFTTGLTYHSVLTGIRESTAAAAMGGTVERILVKVGDKVQKDEVLALFPTDSPAAAYDQARVALASARRAFKRIDGLYRAGGISLQERDNAKTRLDVAEAEWHRVRQMVKVKAPISGFVTKVHVSETDNVEEKTPLVTIARTDKLKAELWVSEDEITSIEKGMAAAATWKGERIEGTVTGVNTAMNGMKKAFRAIVEFDNSDHRLFAGTTVEVNITTSAHRGAIVVERKNIMEIEGKHFVFVVKGDTTERREITLGQQSGLDVEVTGGLREGEQLVTEGQLLLSDGIKIKIVGK